jgi:hypothetical protein
MAREDAEQLLAVRLHEKGTCTRGRVLSDSGSLLGLFERIVIPGMSEKLSPRWFVPNGARQFV